MIDSFEPLISSQKFLQSVFSVPIDSFLWSEWAVEECWLVVLDKKFVLTPDNGVFVINDGLVWIVVQEGNFVGEVND